jgi:4-hydroxybenzoate polyprenyltransferase
MPSPATRSASLGHEWHVGFRIVAEVIAFRLRRLEMANLAGAASIGFVVGLSWAELLYRTAFAFLLNALVYLNNDYLDVAADLRSAERDAPKTRYLAQHLDAALGAQVGLVGLLAAAALAFDAGLLVPLVVGGGTCLWYSRRLKRLPFADVAAMGLWGLAMPLCGFPLDNALGWSLAVQLAFFAAVFESIQVMRDAEHDGAAGLRTTGVVLGRDGTSRLARALIALAAVYAALVLQPLAAVLVACALFVPLGEPPVERQWTRVKLLFGLAWLVICGWLVATGAAVAWTVGAAWGMP